MQKHDDKIVNIGALTMTSGQADGDSSFLMSPFQYISKSDMSDLMGDMEMTDLFHTSPNPISFKNSNEAALFPRSKLPEDDKENAISDSTRIDSCK